MADAYTGSAASSFDQTAYDLRAWYALRYEFYYDACATVKPDMQSFPGSSVTFTTQSDLAFVTTSLSSESTDVSAVAMADTTTNLILAEYGNAVLTTAFIRATSYVPFNPVVANVVGYNAGGSLDTIARNILQAGSNVLYSGGAAGRTSITPNNTLTGNDIRNRVAALRRGNAMTMNGYYIAFIHPDTSYDLRTSTGGAGWVDPHVYSDPQDIWNGEVGTFAGAKFVETPRGPLFADAGSSTTTTDVYGTLLLGQEALAKAYGIQDGNGPLPTIVPGPVTDHLRRFVPIGWYWLGVYGVFRQAALQRIESASSIGANTTAGSN